MPHLDETISPGQAGHIADHQAIAQAINDLEDAIERGDTTVAPGGILWSFVLDEDDMVSNSATKLCTQQSIKAYIDAGGGGGDVDTTDTDVTGWSFVATSITGLTTKVPTDAAVKNYIDALATLTTSDTIKVPIATANGVTTLDVSNLLSTTDATFTDSTFRVQNLTDTSKKVALDVSGVAASTTRTLIVPDLDGTIALTSGAQTFTGKTLTSPLITTGTFEGIHYIGKTRTITTAETEGLFTDKWTVNADFASAYVPAIVHWKGSHRFRQAGDSGSGTRVFYSAGTIKNDSGFAVGIGGSRIFEDANTVTADGSAGLNAGAYASFRASTIYDTSGAGTWTSGTWVGFSANPDINAGVTLSTVSLFTGTPIVDGTVTTLNIYKVNNPTGSGTVTTLYGIDIASLTTGTTNVGIRNNSTLRQIGGATFGSDAAAAAGVAVDVTAGSVLLRDPAAAVGYGTGAGGTVTQTTSKSTAVTLNKPCGTITMDAASLANATQVGFTLNNSVIAATDVVIVNIKSGATVNAYLVNVDTVSAGSCHIMISNRSGGALAEAIVLQFAVIKGVTA